MAFRTIEIFTMRHTIGRRRPNILMAAGTRRWHWLVKKRGDRRPITGSMTGDTVPMITVRNPIDWTWPRVFMAAGTRRRHWLVIERGDQFPIQGSMTRVTIKNLLVGRTRSSIFMAFKASIDNAIMGKRS